MKQSVRALLVIGMGISLSYCTIGTVGDEKVPSDETLGNVADDMVEDVGLASSSISSEELKARWKEILAAWRDRSHGGGGSTGGSTGEGTTGGSTGGSSDGTTGGSSGSTTGGSTGGSNGGTTGGSSGATTGGSSGAATGGSPGAMPPAPPPPGTPGAGAGTSYSCPAAQSTGVVHYVCDCGPGASSQCVAGNDGNTGASPASPWRSYEKARSTFGSMPAGETVAFCRGGSFQAGSNTRWMNTNCRAGKRCIVRDYQPSWSSSTSPAPIISVGSTDRVFSIENPSAPAHEEGYVFAHLNLRGNGKGSGFFFYNDTDDVQICGSSFDKLAIGVHIEGSNPGSGDTRQARIVVKGNRFTNNSGFGFLGGCDDCVVEDNYFENNGSRAVFDHNIYLAGANGAPYQNMRVSRNELYRSAFIDGKCQGVSFVVHGTYDNLLIEDNYIHENIGAITGDCWGLAVDTGYSSGESFNKVTIRGNRVENVAGMFIGLNACRDCVIENNVVVNEQGGNATGIKAPNRARDGDDQSMSSVTVRNNSIYFGKGSSGEGILMGSEGSNHVVTSNAIHYAGNGSFDCFDLDLPKGAYKMVDNNLCFTPNVSPSWVRGVGSLASWRSRTGFDQNSDAKDPGFRSVDAPCHLEAGSRSSAMVDKGHPTMSSPAGFGGAKGSGAPDVGAYQQ